jgi:hypothetical protein
MFNFFNKKKKIENFPPEIKSKLIAEWEEIAKQYGDFSPEKRKLAWIDFSKRIEKEYSLDPWSIWLIVRSKK